MLMTTKDNEVEWRREGREKDWIRVSGLWNQESVRGGKRG